MFTFDVMKEKTLLKIAVMASLLGVVVLYFISEGMMIEEKMIENIDSTDYEKDIRINGKVERVTDMEKIVILEVSQPKKITVVAFKDGKFDIEEGDSVYISGSVEEYRGKPEIIADEIKID